MEWIVKFWCLFCNSGSIFCNSGSIFLLPLECIAKLDHKFMAAIYTFKILNVFTLKRVSNLGCIRFIVVQVLLSNSDLDNRILPFVHLNRLCDASRGNENL